MQTIDLLAGTDIDRAAAMLVASAPARADFNGITIRARYATTKPSDIAAGFRRVCAARSYVYQCSPEGRRAAADGARDIADKQCGVEELMLNLPDFSHVGDVLSWVSAFVALSDRIGVIYDRAAVETMFAAHGWGRGVNCGDGFEPTVARNYAGWIVGQWLDYPNSGLVKRFVAEWVARFERRAA